MFGLQFWHAAEIRLANIMQGLPFFNLHVLHKKQWEQNGRSKMLTFCFKYYLRKQIFKKQTRKRCQNKVLNHLLQLYVLHKQCSGDRMGMAKWGCCLLCKKTFKKQTYFKDVITEHKTVNTLFRLLWTWRQKKWRLQVLVLNQHF